MNVQLRPFIIPVPVELEVHTVLHFKAPVYCKVEPGGKEHGGIFILYNTRSKIGHLLHKSGHCDSDMHTTVILKCASLDLIFKFKDNLYLSLIHI